LTEGTPSLKDVATVAASLAAPSAVAEILRRQFETLLYFGNGGQRFCCIQARLIDSVLKRAA
jgi:hypothetical protein